MLKTLVLITTLALISVLRLDNAMSFADGTSANGFFQQFQAGITAYQGKDYQKALSLFQEALNLSPQNVALLTNLGLTYYQLGQKGYSLAYFRKALHFDPGQKTAQAGLQFVTSTLPIKEIPHQIELYENLRSWFLESTSLLSYILLTALLLGASGWTYLSYVQAQKQGAESNSQILTFGLGVLLLASLALTTLKVYDLQQTRGTIVVEKVSVQTAPGENQATVFDLHEGLEVLTLQKHEQWVLVSYPGGLSGWIPTASVMEH